jgi:hypothetical protein
MNGFLVEAIFFVLEGLNATSLRGPFPLRLKQIYSPHSTLQKHNTDRPLQGCWTRNYQP